jgi:hypothetical protein
VVGQHLELDHRIIDLRVARRLATAMAAIEQPRDEERARNTSYTIALDDAPGIKMERLFYGGSSMLG